MKAEKVRLHTANNRDGYTFIVLNLITTAFFCLSNGRNAVVLPRPHLACLEQHHQTALSSSLLFLKELPLAYLFLGSAF